MDKYYLLVTFGKELESDGNGNEGRRMILKDISGENTYYFGFPGPPYRELILFEEEVIEAIKNKLKIYSQESEQSDFILDGDIMRDYFTDQWDSSIYHLKVNNDVPIIASTSRSPQKEVYLILDPSEAPKLEENKVLRTLATGQSDITRHEAFTKAYGLNWANANVPKYTNNTGSYEYVDLGLHSGTLWAKCNVGATSETDSGLYFAWGETEGYTASQVGVDKQFTWADYKFNPSGDGATCTKYNLTDNKVVLDPEDDAAAVNMGGEWHMPTGDQCRELFKETKNGFVTNAGTFTQYAWNDANSSSSPTSTTAAISGWDTAGYFFFKKSYTSVTEAITAEDYLFIPAAGRCSGGEVNDVGGWGDVWSSSLSTDNVLSAWNFRFANRGAGVNGNYYRCSGLSVRGVIGNIDK